jgi:hypothetical protein
MGNLRLYGSTSGYTELAPPAVAPDGVLSLPSGVGTLLTAEGGKVLQVVRATDTTQRTTTSTSLVDVTGMSVTITPQKSTSAILVISTFYALAERTSGTPSISFYVLSDSANNALSGGSGIIGTNGSAVSFYTYLTLIGYSTPATTSPVTYKLRFSTAGAASTTAYVRNDQTAGQLYAIEVSA